VQRSQEQIKGTSASEWHPLKISGCVLPPQAAFKCFERKRGTTFQEGPGFPLPSWLEHVGRALISWDKACES